jgi:hypothetical protein
MFPTVNNKKFGEWLAFEREKRGWSQSELSPKKDIPAIETGMFDSP